MEEVLLLSLTRFRSTRLELASSGGEVLLLVSNSLPLRRSTSSLRSYSLSSLVASEQVSRVSVRAKEMEDSGLLYELAIRSDNRVLDLLRRTPSWKYLAPMIENNNRFWYQRVEYLLGENLAWDPSADWKEVYYDFQLLDVKNDPRRVHGVFTSELLENAASVKIALDLGYMPVNRDLVSVAGRGYTDSVKLLLQSPAIDPRYQESRALRQACYDGQVEVVRVLLDDGRSNPKDAESVAVYLAIEGGNTEIVKMLLEDGRANPRDDGNAALIAAVQTNQPEVVALLLNDGRADPTVDNGYLLQEARENDYWEVLELLAADKRVQAAGLA